MVGHLISGNQKYVFVQKIHLTSDNIHSTIDSKFNRELLQAGPSCSNMK